MRESGLFISVPLINAAIIICIVTRSSPSHLFCSANSKTTAGSWDSLNNQNLIARMSSAADDHGTTKPRSRDGQTSIPMPDYQRIDFDGAAEREQPRDIYWVSDS